jgi:methionyl aminopeptidase
MIHLKGPDEIRSMRRAGRIVADVLVAMGEKVRPGIDTESLDRIAESIIERAGALPSFRGYRAFGIKDPFPSSICVSINEEVVHGIPDPKRFLQEGDIVSVDVGAQIEGYCGDAACTYPVGAISPERSRLLEQTRASLHRGIEAIRPGATLGDVGHAVESWVKQFDYGVIRDYAGHGIGRHMHETPQVPNYGRPGEGIVLKSRMTFCVEPMITNGGEDVKSLPNGWTVVTRDRSDAAHFEHSLLVTDEGAEILTPWE